MPVVIHFDFETDHERALDVLFEIEATYSGAGSGSIQVSPAAAQALRERGIRYRVISGEACLKFPR